MGYPRAVAFVMIGAALTALPCWVQAEVLTYKGDNKWVATEDNKPLQALLKTAREGKLRFSVMLPLEHRELAVSRLEVVRDLLAREAQKAVIMEEVSGAAKANTVVVE